MEVAIILELVSDASLTVFARVVTPETIRGPRWFNNGGN